MAIWGKLLGGAAGLALGGPIGALLGGVAGHVLDQWRSERTKRERVGHPGAEPPPIFTDPLELRRIALATAVIVLGAKLAKADGVVSRDEVRAFKRVFRVSDTEVGGVARIFDEAKRTAGGFEPYARQIAVLFRNEPEVLEELLHGLFEIAAVDGVVNQAELAFLAGVAGILGFSPEAFEQIRARCSAAHVPHGREDPYTVLGLASSATDEDVRKTWRRLVREHHPDRLASKGMPKEFIDQANRTLAAINAAYDEIAKERGLR